jgi:hypothetical protein
MRSMRGKSVSRTQMLSNGVCIQQCELKNVLLSPYPGIASGENNPILTFLIKNSMKEVYKEISHLCLPTLTNPSSSRHFGVE